MARGKIASLFIGLGANTVELDTKLGKSKKKVKAFSNDLATMGKAGAKAFAGLGLAGGAALTAIYKSTAPAIDEMGKLSRQTGVTVSELQSLRHAAELNGVASGYMDKALEKFVRQLGDAKKGIGAAKFMLDEMGLSADNLSKLGTSEAIKVIADEISHMGNEMDKSSAAAALFGRNGMAMVNMFDDGRMAIDAAAKELDAYGLKLSEIDVGKVEASNDAWERIGALMKNAGQIITVELSPYIEAIAKYFLTAAKQAGGFRSVTVNAMEGVIWSIGLVADSIQGLKLVWHGVSLASQAVYTSMIAWVRDWDNAITTIIDKVPGYTAKASSSINKLYVEAATAYSEANLKFLQLTNAPTASNVLKNSLDEVKATAEVAIDELAQMRAKKKAAEVSTAQLDFSSQLDQDIENYNYTEEAFRQHMAVMAEIKNPGTEEDIENYSYRLDQERAFQSQLNDIVSTGLHSRNEFESASFKSQFQSVAGNLAAVTAQAAQHDKKMFKINKAANIANAIMNTYTGVSKTLATYPILLAAPLAALHLAAGIAQVKAIKNQSFGSTSMSSTGVGGGSVPLNIPQPNLEVPAESEENSQQGITIIVNGHILDKTGLEDLVQEATQGITNRDGLLFNQDSAQAQMAVA